MSILLLRSLVHAGFTNCQDSLLNGKRPFILTLAKIGIKRQKAQFVNKRKLRAAKTKREALVGCLLKENRLKQQC